MDAEEPPGGVAHGFDEAVSQGGFVGHLFDQRSGQIISGPGDYEEWTCTSAIRVRGNPYVHRLKVQHL
jgi:hypothetical protein